MGSESLPAAAELWRAIEIYLAHAYPGGEPTPMVKQRLERLRAAGEWPWADDVFEKTESEGRIQYGIRLGNAWYPHMKLAVEKSPDSDSYLLRVDTHDHHIRPDRRSPEYEAFCEMQRRNSKLAAQIESAWAEKSLLTFKELLRRDLQYRADHPAK